MKKLIFVLLTTLATCLQAQNLANTTWLGTNPPSPNLWFQYSADTLSFSMGTGVYTPMSVYTASGGQFAIFDFLAGSLCTDTGFYTYSISANHLSFSLVSDACSSRRNTLLNYTWTLLSTDVPAIEPGRNIQLSSIQVKGDYMTLLLPDQKNQRVEIELFSETGTLVLTQSASGPVIRLDIRSIATGIYFGRILTDSGQAYRIRIVRSTD